MSRWRFLTKQSARRSEIMECGGKRSATPLWVSDKLQFVVVLTFHST
jgi:hypothetical protein